MNPDTPLVSRASWLGFAVVVLVALGVYLASMAPTLSFWDCGEFIASAATLGIPHPPGSPLHVFIARLCVLLPLASDIAVRVNILSAVSSALAAGFLFLCLMALSRDWECTDSPASNTLVRMIASACGAWLGGFGITQWNNAVEAEVYGLAMLILFASLLLVIGMLQTSDSIRRSRYLILAVFLTILGVADHMTVALILPIMIVVGALRTDSPGEAFQDLLLLVFFNLTSMILLSSRPGELPLWVMGIPVAILSILLLTGSKAEKWSYLIRGGSFSAILPILALAYPASYGVFGAIGIIGSVVMIAATLYWHFTAGSTDEPPPRSLFLLQLALALLLIIQILRLTGLVPFAVITAIIGLGYLWWYRASFHWPVFVSLAAVTLVVSGVVSFLVAVGIAAVAVTVMAFYRLTGWKTAAAVLVAGTLGFSFQLTIPIRSAQHPLINENAPYRSFAATVAFIERKQYGNESMLTRMFQRRAEWGNQFGAFQRIGLYGYLQSQSSDRRFFAPYLLLAGLALWELSRRRGSTGALVIIFLLLAAVGLVLYMNFADGTRIDPQTGEDYLEVRERDYFYTPAFMLFGALTGLGLLAVLASLRQAGVHLRREIAITAVLLPTVLLPTVAVATNWAETERSSNYIPYDYATALLDSVEPNGVLVTAGDNDTFPLWCLQHAYGYRADVRVVNTSLGNLDWYINQLQHEFHLPLGLDEQAVAAMRPYRTEDGRVFMISDQVVNAIISRYADSLPIYFATTVGADQRTYDGRNIDSLLVMEGAAFRYVPAHRGGMTVNTEKSYRLFLGPNGFRYRGYADTSLRKDAATLQALGTIENSVEATAEALRRKEDFIRAEQLARLAVDSFPRTRTALELLASVWLEMGNRTAADSVMAANRDIDGRRITMGRLAALRDRGDTTAAVAGMRALLDTSPAYRPALDELVRTHINQNNVSGMIADLKRWTERNPADSDIAQAYRMLRDDTLLLQRLRSGRP